MTASKLLIATALSGVLATSAMAQDRGAKNVILMVSDGIGFNGWLAADYYQGRANQQSYQVTRPDGTTPVVLGLDHHALNLINAAGDVLPSGTDPSEAAGAVAQGYDPTTRWMSFESTIRNDFPPVGERYTSYTDSAAAGTALMAGRKTSNGRINMDWTGTETFKTIAELAMDQGKATGSVISVMVSHATGAATIAHNTSRNNYVEIFNEMVASDMDVIMGAGHPFFDNSGNAVEPKDEDAYRFVGGSDTLAALTSEEGLNGYSFIDAKSSFEALAAGEDLPERVVGVAQAGSTLQASREDLGAGDTPSGMAFNPLTPDLATMSLGALNVLNQDEDGFFVMIEGGAVDWMGHRNDMPRFIEEQIDFNLAVDAVIAWVEENSSWDETLLIVTSDHECGGIWGEGTWTNGAGGPVAADRSDEAVLSARYDPTEDVFVEYRAVQDRGAGNMPGYMFSSRNHTNELVPLWALGAGAQLFAEFTQTDLGAAKLWGAQYDWSGDYVDNTAVFHVMNEAFAFDAAQASQ
ncbi:MAG: alkaline phosphatase [Pseudomonadota bacterium]